LELPITQFVNGVNKKIYLIEVVILLNTLLKNGKRYEFESHI
jgi:hypothetical protein